MLRAAAGSLPFIPRGDHLPNRTLTVEDLSIDPSNVAAYASVTGLRFGDTVPLTYPFVLTFPTVMALITGFDFPFAAMGAVHVENEITRYRPIAVTDTVNLKVHAENLREHRKGLLVDVVADIHVGNERAWHQVTTFLHQQRTSLSGGPPKAEPPKRPKLPPPNTILRISPPGQIRRYASIGGGPQSDPHHPPDRCQAVRFPPHRDRPRHVQCGSGFFGQYRGSDSRCRALLGEVRQARHPAGHRRALHRPGLRRLGHRDAQPVEGLPAPHRNGSRTLAFRPSIPGAYSVAGRSRRCESARCALGSSRKTPRLRAVSVITSNGAKPKS